MSHNIFSKFGYYAIWVMVYFCIVGGTTAFAATMYKKYETEHLPSGNIELSIHKSVYQLGEVVEFTLTNHFPVPIYVTNRCPNAPLNIYQWKNNSWEQINVKAVDSNDCYTKERNVAIQSESARTYNFADWPDLFDTPGVYRIAAAINHYDNIPFQDFVILEPAEVVEIFDPPKIIYAEKVSNPEPVVLPTEVIPETTFYEEYKEEEVYDEDYDEDDEREESGRRHEEYDD